MKKAKATEDTMPRVNATFIQTALDVAKLAITSPEKVDQGQHEQVVAAILEACSTLERHQDSVMGLPQLIALARQACGTTPHTIKEV
jgi:hypothetical protein